MLTGFRGHTLMLQAVDNGMTDVDRVSWPHTNVAGC